MNAQSTKQESTKLCSQCKELKPVSEFSKDKSRKDGFYHRCKFCVNQYSKQHYLKNREEILLRQKKHNLTPEYKEKKKIYDKKYNSEHMEEGKLKDHLYYIEKKEEITLKTKLYNFKHQDEIRYSHNEYTKNRRKTNLPFRILHNVRSSVSRIIKNNVKSGHTIELLMCSVEELKDHLEKHFRIGMTWKNYGSGKGKWTIDHIIPCSFFNISDPVEQYMCFQWQNCQPLWWEDNMTKSDNVTINL